MILRIKKKKKKQMQNEDCILLASTDVFRLLDWTLCEDVWPLLLVHRRTGGQDQQET